jgi:hypothetical protein
MLLHTDILDGGLHIGRSDDGNMYNYRPDEVCSPILMASVLTDICFQALQVLLGDAVMAKLKRMRSALFMLTCGWTFKHELDLWRSHIQ